jgi:hypothetical protein
VGVVNTLDGTLIFIIIIRFCKGIYYTLFEKNNKESHVTAILSNVQSTLMNAERSTVYLFSHPSSFLKIS